MTSKPKVCPTCGRGKEPTHDEALELLAQAARDGKLQAIVAYQRAMWREERGDEEAGSKKNRNKVSRATKVLDDLENAPDEPEPPTDTDAAQVLADALA